MRLTSQLLGILVGAAGTAHAAIIMVVLTLAYSSCTYVVVNYVTATVACGLHVETVTRPFKNIPTEYGVSRRGRPSLFHPRQSGNADNR